MDSSDATPLYCDPLGLTLTSSVPSEYPSIHRPAKPYKVPKETYSFEASEIISDAISFELHDNVKNGELSENDLAFRCKVFKSVFAAEVVGPQGASKAMLNSSQDGKEVEGSDDEDTPRVPKASAAAGRKSAVKKRVVRPGPRAPVPGLAASGGYDRDYRAKMVNVLPPVPDNGAKKPKKKGSRSKSRLLPKRQYKWKDPQNKNKKQFYKTRADEAGISVEEYMERHNIVQGSVATTTPDHGNANSQTELTEMDEDFEEQEGYDSDEIEQDEDMTHVEEEDDDDDEDEENLFVTKPTASRSAPTMTAHRVAMLANQYMEELYLSATTAPIDDIKSTIQRALEKIKAGAAAQLDEIEQFELRGAVERYEDLL